MSGNSSAKYIVLLITGLLAACASTKPVKEWRSEEFSGQSGNILVIAATEQQAQRRSIEDDYVVALQQVPVQAVASYTLIDSEQPLTRETVEAAIEGQGFDTVLVTRLLGVEEVEQYQPPVHYDHYRSYHRYYQRSLNYSSPGYYRRFKILTLESNLYDTASGELVWSMQSESIDPSAPEKVVAEQIALTIERLKQAGLLGAGQ